VTDSYRVLIIEDDQDPTTYLRLALLRTRRTEHPVRCPASVRALLRAVTSTTRAGTNDSAAGAPWGHQRPITLILDETPARLEVLTAYFGDAGCAVIAVTNVEQALSMCSVVSPDLMVLPQPRTGLGGAGWDKLRSRYQTCPVAVTSVIDPGAELRPAPLITTAAVDPTATPDDRTVAVTADAR
jgi:CheY-like chemotaxis protein